MIGPLHLQRKLPCQDACSYRTLSGATLIAVADGLGSAAQSETGSKLAVAAAIQALETMLSTNAAMEREELVREAARTARRALEGQQNSRLNDLACTLILALFETKQLTVAHVGDGAVVADFNGALQMVSGPGDSEFTNEVIPLTSSTWERELRITSAGMAESIAVFTDGCQRAAFRKTEAGLVPFDGFFRPIFSFAREITDAAAGLDEIQELLASNKMCHNSDDDKTLVIAVRNISQNIHD